MKPTICIITGSTLGGAEYVADHLNNVLEAQGFDVALFNQAELADIADQTHLVVVTSTHGAGELPDNIKPLFEDIQTQSPDFSRLKFGVVGLGSSDYDTFCNSVNIVEHVLIAQGASLVCKSLRIDVTQELDPDSSAENWLRHFIAMLN